MAKVECPCCEKGSLEVVHGSYSRREPCEFCRGGEIEVSRANQVDVLASFFDELTEDDHTAFALAIAEALSEEVRHVA